MDEVSTSGNPRVPAHRSTAPSGSGEHSRVMLLCCASPYSSMDYIPSEGGADWTAGRTGAGGCTGWMGGSHYMISRVHLVS